MSPFSRLCSNPTSREPVSPAPGFSPSTLSDTLELRNPVGEELSHTRRILAGPLASPSYMPVAPLEIRQPGMPPDVAKCPRDGVRVERLKLPPWGRSTLPCSPACSPSGCLHVCPPLKRCCGPERFDLPKAVLSVTGIRASSILVLVTALALVPWSRCLRAHVCLPSPQRAQSAPPPPVSVQPRVESHRTELCGSSSVPSSEGGQQGRPGGGEDSARGEHPQRPPQLISPACAVDTARHPLCTALRPPVGPAALTVIIAVAFLCQEPWCRAGPGLSELDRTEVGRT